jgi:hypothetical protein
LIHVYSKTRAALLELAPAVREAEAARPGRAPALGDPLPSSRELTVTRAALSALLGPAFAEAVFAQATGVWGEPVQSKLGWHLAKIVGRDPGRAATFEEAAREVVSDWTSEHRQAAVNAFLTRAFARYRVYVDGERVADLKPTGRLAQPASSSAED